MPPTFSDHSPEPSAWPEGEEAAIAEQERLRAFRRDEPLPLPRLVTGVDVSYDPASERLVAAAVTIDVSTWDTVEEVTRLGTARFPYIPGLLAFRELPTLLEALADLSTAPDLFVCDGHGLAHPRAFGLACHLGVLLDVPTIGVAKNAPWPTGSPGEERGATAPILREGEEVGRVLRTRASVKPVYVSAGHRADLDGACAAVLELTRGTRQPETTRRADALSRRLLKG